MNLTELTISQALAGFLKKEFTVTELVQAYMDKIEKHGKEINCFTSPHKEGKHPLVQAMESDLRRADGKARALDGMPIGLMDSICTKGIRTAAASKMLENFTPDYSATVAQKLDDAGAVMLGKLKMDEFGIGANKCVGDAVANGLVIGAIGTGMDAAAGVVKHKPTFGLCSRFGVVAATSSLDSVGTITRSAADAEIMLGVIAGFDDKDAMSAGRDANPIKEISKIGIVKEFGKPDATGIENLVEVSIPLADMATRTYHTIAAAEISANLARYDGVRYGFRAEDTHGILEMYEQTRAQGFCENVKKQIITGTAVLSSGLYEKYFVQACRIRTMISDSINAAFEKCDLIITPASDAAAACAMFAGLPATIMPNGVMIIGKQFDDFLCLRLAQKMGC